MAESIASPDEMVRQLLAKDEIFGKLFTCVYEYHNLQPEEQSKAQRIFQETFPTYTHNLLRFHAQWILTNINKNLNPTAGETLNETNNDDLGLCPDLIYDPMSRRRIRPQVLPPAKRRKLDKFDLSKFIRQKREQGEYFELSMPDRSFVENLQDELNEDKPRNDQKADVALNKIVQMCAVLNGSCSYRLLDLHSEKRIR